MDEYQAPADKYLHSALRKLLIAYTIPGKPSSGRQKYRLTKKGACPTGFATKDERRAVIGRTMTPIKYEFVAIDPTLKDAIPNCFRPSATPCFPTPSRRATCHGFDAAAVHRQSAIALMKASRASL
jgi:hypothetical protein